MKEKLISRELIRGLHPVFRGRFGNTIIKILLSVTGIYKVNNIYDASKHLTGLEYVNDMIDKFSITCVYENIEVLDQFKDQPFITVSNHPYGHIDGIIKIGTLAGIRRDFKMMVNWMLMQIDTMEEFFIGVNPYAKDNKMAGAKSSIGGVRQCLEHLRNGHPLGFFPAGGISNPSFKAPVDREWQESVLKIIKKAKVPVVPLYISGRNSWFFQLLGFIDWRVRMVRLCHEVTNKKGRTIHLRFGNPVFVEEQNKYDDIKKFGEFLKSKTYEGRKAGVWD